MTMSMSTGLKRFILDMPRQMGKSIIQDVVDETINGLMDNVSTSSGPLQKPITIDDIRKAADELSKSSQDDGRIWPWKTWKINPPPDPIRDTIKEIFKLSDEGLPSDEIAKKIEKMDADISATGLINGKLGRFDNFRFYSSGIKVKPGGSGLLGTTS